MFAHVAGIPLEETALGLVPVAALALGGVATAAARLRHSLRHPHRPRRWAR